MSDAGDRPTDAPGDRPTDRIEAALAQLGGEHEPPVGWEVRVLAAVGATRRRRWWWYAAPTAAVAAIAIVLVLVHRPPPVLALNVEVKHGMRVRGTGASVGDVVQIRVSGGRGQRAIWVYHEDIQVVLRCPGDPTCRLSDASTEVDLTLRSAGAYTVVALTGSARLPPLVGSYDADTAAAEAAGFEVQHSPLTVE